MALEFNIRHVEKKDLQLEGKLPAEELALEHHDAQIRTNKPLQYDLMIQRLSHDILVQGSLHLTLDCDCVRCLKPFKFEIDLPDWAVDLPLQGEDKVVIKNDSVDLTPYIREDILLAFPQHPLCKPDCAGLPKRVVEKAKKTKGAQTEDSSAWSELNKLKF